MPINDSLIRCDDCHYAGHVLDKHQGYKWWMVPLGFFLLCTGVGLIPIAVVLIYLGNRTHQVCPKCGGKNFITWTGAMTPGADDVWLLAHDADERIFKLNKQLLLATVLALFAAVVALCVWKMSRI